jgi:dCTP deaminase
MDRIKELDGLPAINLEDGAALEPKAVYLVPLYEVVELKSDEYGVANPKSSTGRLDVLTRLITDGAMEFDRIEKGYRGQLYLEIAPLTFSIIVRAGIRLNQVRIHRDRGNSGTLLRQQDTQALYSAGQLISSSGQLPPLREGVLVPVTVDLRGSRPGSIIGYKARKNTNKIDLSKIDYYNPKDFWYDIRSYDGRLNLDQNEFYILSTREDVGVPPSTAAEMVPYDSRSGEFRVHYAGFFDPGFGWVDGKASGSKAVLEVRSYGVPFTIEHGQTVGWLRYAPIVGQGAEKLYGSDGIKSNYQGQGLALAKYFKPWPHLDPVPTYDHPMLDWWGK